MQELQRKIGPAVFTYFFFDELLMHNADGRLPRELAAHALWYYYGTASKAYIQAKENIVYEDELSHKFGPAEARGLFLGVSNMYGIPPDKMVRFWPNVESQRRALKLTDELPDALKFRFWGH